MTASSDQMRRLKEARNKMAHLILMDPIYIPIWKRLEAEIIAQSEEQDIFSQARHCVRDQRATG
jgi:hypothetical protein